MVGGGVCVDVDTNLDNMFLDGCGSVEDDDEQPSLKVPLADAARDLRLCLEPRPAPAAKPEQGQPHMPDFIFALSGQDSLAST